MSQPVPQGVTLPTPGLGREQPELSSEEDIPTDADPADPAAHVDVPPRPPAPRK